ncbi:MAG TPA: LysR family transcriptional regulator [Beijerinckiaceae bacterium]|jgi:DNA-binding transcriptional LysR family regulator
MQPNLVDQLTAFIAVVETASFSEAARRLGRAVSTVSYSVTRLEEQCGYPLLRRGAGRPELTPKGRALYREAQGVVEGARRFAARARSLGRGEEARLGVAVDVLFPLSALMGALATFGAEYPHVRLQLFTTSLNRLWGDLRSGALDLCLAPLRDVPDDVERQPLTTIELILAAAAHHPLARRRAPFDLAELRAHRQLYYAGASNVDVERMGRVFGTDVWTGSDLWTIRLMLRAGLGWCFATEEFLGEDLRSGEVARLDCSELRSDGRWVFGAVWHIDRPPGLVGQRLVELVQGELAPLRAAAVG